MSKVQPYSTYSTFFLVIVTVLVLFFLTTVTTRKPHLINFRSPNLYPEGLTWDPLSNNFLVGSLHQRTIKSISKTGVVQNLIFDPTLPENTTIVGITVDSIHNRLLAVIQSIPPLPPFNAIVAYDLHLHQQIFLSLLPSLNHNATIRDAANDVTTDDNGNAYITNSAGNFIWKVNTNGEASIFSISSLYTKYLSNVDHSKPFSSCGLNGIAYIKDGYLLVVQSNTGKLFKVDVEDGTAKLVTLARDLRWGDGMAVRRDGVVLVVSQRRLWWLKSCDEWGKGIVYEESEVKVEGFATSVVVVGGEEKIYVLYGHVIEGILGNNKDVGREEFSIEEVREKEDGEKMVWVILLLGLGLAYLFVS